MGVVVAMGRFDCGKQRVGPGGLVAVFLCVLVSTEKKDTYEGVVVPTCSSATSSP